MTEWVGSRCEFKRDVGDDTEPQRKLALVLHLADLKSCAWVASFVLENIGKRPVQVIQTRLSHVDLSLQRANFLGSVDYFVLSCFVIDEIWKNKWC